MLSKGKKYTDVLLEILTNKEIRIEIKEMYRIDDSTFSDLYKLLVQLVNSDRTNWQILKELQLSSFYNIYSDILLSYMLYIGSEEYLEVVEILNS